jgi:Uma2 family endonuclease
MSTRKPKSNDPHDKFIKRLVPVVLKKSFDSETSVSVELAEELAIDVLCKAVNQNNPMAIDPELGLLGRLMAVHPTIIVEHYSGLENIDSCVLRSGMYWERRKGQVDSEAKVRVTKKSAVSLMPLHPKRPFTWILTTRCGENSLRRWGATPATEFGEHVYGLGPPGLSIGVVDIESLPDGADTVVLKLMGKAASARKTFEDLSRLNFSLELRSDIISVSIKHCIYGSGGGVGDCAVRFWGDGGFGGLVGKPCWLRLLKVRRSIMSAFLDVTRSDGKNLNDEKSLSELKTQKLPNGLPVDDEFPCSDGKPVDSELQELVPGLLKSILMRIWKDKLDYLFAIDMGFYYGSGCVSADGLLCLEVEQPKHNLKRSSYILSKEKVVPVLVLEVVSKTYGGEYDEKKVTYQKIGILYYVIYSPLLDDAERLEVYKLVDGEYVLQVGLGDERRVWMPEVGLAIGREKQVYDRAEREWLYWYDEAGCRYSTPMEAEQAEAERADAEAARSQLLADRLRELGVDPELL